MSIKTEIEWFHFDDKLPETDDYLFILDKDNEIHIGFFNIDNRPGEIEFLDKETCLVIWYAMYWAYPPEIQ